MNIEEILKEKEQYELKLNQINKKIKNKYEQKYKTEIENMNKIIGYNLKIARKEKNLTQEELSKLCLMARTSIVQLENGKNYISIKKLFFISKILEKDMNYFFNKNKQD